jgi:hypothetical protein
LLFLLGLLLSGCTQGPSLNIAQQTVPDMAGKFQETKDYLAGRTDQIGADQPCVIVARNVFSDPDGKTWHIVW